MPATISVMNDTGVANNVTSAAGVGLRLALLLNAVACQVANLGVDIHSISKGISLFSNSLKQLGQSLQAEHSVHTRECLDTARQISDQARTVFEEVEDMLEKVQKAEVELEQKDVPVQQRFKDCFKKQRVTYLLAQLESLKLSLMVMVQILHLGRLREVKNVLNTLTNELIVQERAEAQNMLIVRYWSIKKLDRLWELARQEAKEDRRSTVHFDSDEKKTTSSTDSPPLTKLPIIALGVESSLSSMEESPSDMLRLTQEVLDALLSRWIRVEAGQSARPPPQAYVYSGSDDELSDDDSIDRDSMHGYYLEGVTTDWRKPHSQEARVQAAQLRKMYSDKQAQVHSDSDGSEDSIVRNGKHHAYSRRKKKKKAYTSSEYDDMPEQAQMDTNTNPTTSRPYSYSKTNAVPGCDAESHWRHTSGSAKPQQPTTQAQSRPIPVPQAMKNNLNMNNSAQLPRLATSQPTRGVPSSPSTRNASPSSYYKPPTHGFPTPASSYTQQHPYYYPQQQPQQQYRQYSNPTPNFARTLSDNTLLHPPQHQQPRYLKPHLQSHRHRPSRLNRTSKGGSSGSSSSSSSGSGGNRSPSPYNRHKDLKRTAMRGILGASAIGGFMDALEAFSII
ncbi:hypothetical protein TSTA_017720 [Talaromyces stipitatus ATCC 10500]|uniref:Fungal N-terminal domain-containing protein n=1 Tax=Talaromyces stipitatus (strain ATCC 10500 / CBS 375.48 / QM 6759 / NRRL 1006) TaxID=441959 RepID=B8MFG4_TALSN|nr:uncharacterized protein TSTA_017720 [Talaromyces stipitatus ATCC 10500]EED16698.1 hypothetical protein TSTA_017720 [Talaromyces stipitatus ATCC 10500]